MAVDTGVGTAHTAAPGDTALAAEATAPPEETRVDETIEPAKDTSPAACIPNPFVPPYAKGEWRNSLETGVLTIPMGAPNHRGQDVIVAAGEPQRLIAKFAYGAIDKDLKDEDVEVFYQPDAPCGAWESLGVFPTSEDGEYGTMWGVADDGGRIFVELPMAKRLPVGVYPVRMLVKGDLSIAAFTLWVTAPSVSVVVTDIDGTLTTSDFELITQIFTDLFSGSYVPEAYPGGQDVLWAYRQKGYQIIYVTGRPDLLRAQTQTWLVDLGYPPGVVHLTDTNTQAFPTDAGVAAYKTDFLNKVVAEAQAAFYAAYGNATTDIHAYANVNIPKNRTYIIGANAGQEGTVAVNAYPSHLPTAQAAPAALVPGPTPPDVNKGWW